jgi:hypothetical protein
MINKKPKNNWGQSMLIFETPLKVNQKNNEVKFSIIKHWEMRFRRKKKTIKKGTKQNKEE